MSEVECAHVVIAIVAGLVAAGVGVGVYLGYKIPEWYTGNNCTLSVLDRFDGKTAYYCTVYANKTRVMRRGAEESKAYLVKDVDAIQREDLKAESFPFIDRCTPSCTFDDHGMCQVLVITSNSTWTQVLADASIDFGFFKILATIVVAVVSAVAGYSLAFILEYAFLFIFGIIYIIFRQCCAPAEYRSLSPSPKPTQKTVAVVVVQKTVAVVVEE